MSAVGSALVVGALSAAISSALSTRSRAVEFPMSALWSTSEQGLWYDPSDFERYMAKGPELVTNGNFSNGTTGWVGWRGTLATVAGGLRLTITDHSGYAYTDIATVPGTTYLMRFTLVADAATGNTFFRARDVATLAALFDGNIGSTLGVHQFTFTATGTTSRIEVSTSTAALAGETLTFTGVTCCALPNIATATLFQDAAGTTPVTAMEQPVGLVLDKRLGLVRGAELVVNGNFSGGSTGWAAGAGGGTFTVVGDSAQCTSSATSNELLSQNIPTIAGRTYEVTWEVRAANQNTGVYFVSGSLQSSGVVTVLGPRRAVLVADVDNEKMVFVGGGANTTATLANISVRELPGNHASQTTTASKAVLSARKNLLTKTDQFVSPWTFTNASGGASLVGNTITMGANAIDRIVQPGTLGPGATVTLSVKLSGSGSIRLFLSDADGGTRQNITVALTPTPTVYTLTHTIGFTGSSGGTVGIYNNAAGTAGAVCTLHEAQVEYGSTATRYQRVNTATDYDWVGFPMYLKFDGVDDGLVTNSIDFTATDKMTVVAGVRKLSDAATAVIAELSSHVGTNAGAFALFAPNTAYGANAYVSNARGTAADAAGLNASLAGFASPDLAVLTALHNIAGDSSQLRRNGGAYATAVGDKGAGNFGNYPLYIGRRGGTSLPFNGYLYQLGIRGALTENAKLKPWERDTGNKTGATIA